MSEELSSRRLFDALLRDVRYALRRLRKTPVFAAVAILILALGIGANTAMFSLLHALILRDLPVRNANELTQLSVIMRSGQQVGLSLPAFQELERQSPVFSSLVAWTDVVLTVEANGALTRDAVSTVTGNFYSELGVRPVLGRLLTSEDVNLETYSPVAVAVLGYGFWQRQFGGDPTAVGRVVRVEGVPFTVVGVTPKGFRGLTRTVEAAIALPLTANSLLPGRAGKPAGNVLWLNVLGRRKPHVTLDEARAQLTAQWPQVLAATMPAEFSGIRRVSFLAISLVVDTVRTPSERLLLRQFARPLLVVMGIALFVLLIASVNLAGLMLARAATRSHEFGVQLALGASRWRLVQEMLTEGLVISLMGGLCGLAVAPWTGAVLARMILANGVVSSSLDTSADARVIAFTAGLAITVGLVFSGIPAWRASRRDPLELLQRGGRTFSASGRLGRVLVCSQIALCLILLVNAGLLVRTLQALRSISPGFVTDDVTEAFLQPRPGDSLNFEETYVPALVARAAILPGVRQASVSVGAPGAGQVPIDLVASMSAPQNEIAAAYNGVSPGFFQLLGIRVEEGRDFTWNDREHAPRVAIISRGLARRLFPNGEVLGQSLRIGVLPPRQNLQVIGVVADARLYDIKDANAYAVYMPYLQDAQGFGLTLLVRGTNLSFEEVSRVVASLGHHYLVTTESLEQVKERALMQQRVTALLAEFFGGLALLLAGIGIYGLIAYDVTERTKELGIRLALGARPQRMISAIVAHAVRIAGIGIAAGLALSLLSGQLVRSLLFGITDRDVVTLSAVPLVLLGVAIVAALVPATKAARINPIVTLRTE